MSDGYKTYDKTTIAIQKLSPQDGDVIVISFPYDINPDQMLKFAEELQPKVSEDVTILCARAGVTIEHFPKESMAKMGWYKFDDKKVN